MKSLDVMMILLCVASCAGAKTWRVKITNDQMLEDGMCIEKIDISAAPCLPMKGFRPIHWRKFGTLSSSATLPNHEFILDSIDNLACKSSKMINGTDMTKCNQYKDRCEIDASGTVPRCKNIASLQEWTTQNKAVGKGDAYVQIDGLQQEPRCILIHQIPPSYSTTFLIDVISSISIEHRLQWSVDVTQPTPWADSASGKYMNGSWGGHVHALVDLTPPTAAASGMSAGGIVVIVISVLALISIVVGGAIYIKNKRKNVTDVPLRAV